MQDEKSQIQNRAKAMQVLRARLLKLEQDRQAAELSAERKGQVGGGGRSEKIRTYNFKENRVTDHRIGLTLYKLDKVLAGDLDDVVDALVADEQAPAAAATASDRRRAGAQLRAESLDRLRAGGRSTTPTRRSRWIVEQATGRTAAEQVGVPRRARHRARGALRSTRWWRRRAGGRAAAVRARAAGAFRTLDLSSTAGCSSRGRRPRWSPGWPSTAAARPRAAERRRRPRHRLGRDRPLAGGRAWPRRRGVGDRSRRRTRWRSPAANLAGPRASGGGRPAGRGRLVRRRCPTSSGAASTSSSRNPPYVADGRAAPAGGGGLGAARGARSRPDRARGDRAPSSRRPRTWLAPTRDARRGDRRAPGERRPRDGAVPWASPTWRSTPISPGAIACSSLDARHRPSVSAEPARVVDATGRA